MHSAKVLFCIFIITLAKVSSTGLSKVQYQFYLTCMENRNSQEWFELLPKEEAKQCMRFLGLQGRTIPEERNESTEGIERESLHNMARKVSLRYFQGLNIWKNDENDLGPSILEHISPCWKHSQELEREWISVFKKRRNNVVAMHKIMEQSWEGEEGVAFIRPSVKNHGGGELKAAELILHRESPSAIGENFGRYRTTVYVMEGNVTEKRIHADFQSSCSSKLGNMMALDLNVDDIAVWKDMNKILKLRVRVQPRRQYFKPGRNVQMTRVQVVKQIVGLVVHFAPSVEEISTNLMSAYSEQSDYSQPDSDEVTQLSSALFPVDPEDNDEEFYNSELSTNLVNAALHRQQHPSFGPERRRRNVQGKPLSRQQRNNGATYTNTRVPLSPSPSRPLQCHRASHRISHDMYQRLKIVYPDHGHRMFDIGECSGSCPFPISSNKLNATNHSFAISIGMRGNPTLTICCVPVTYKPMFYTEYDRHDDLYQKELKNFIAVSCACR